MNWCHVTGNRAHIEIFNSIILGLSLSKLIFNFRGIRQKTSFIKARRKCSGEVKERIWFEEVVLLYKCIEFEFKIKAVKGWRRDVVSSVGAIKILRSVFQILAYLKNFFQARIRYLLIALLDDNVLSPIKNFKSGPRISIWLISGNSRFVYTQILLLMEIFSDGKLKKKKKSIFGRNLEKIWKKKLQGVDTYTAIGHE